MVMTPVGRCLPWQAPVVRGALLALLLLASPAPAAQSIGLEARTRWSVDQARAGERILLTVVIDIPEGLHIYADAGQLPPLPGVLLYPARVEILARSPSGVAVGAPRYPPAQTMDAGFDQPLPVFDGRLAVTIPVEVPPGAAGAVGIRLALHFQGCDAASCYMPETLILTTRLPLAPHPLP